MSVHVCTGTAHLHSARWQATAIPRARWREGWRWDGRLLFAGVLLAGASATACPALNSQRCPRRIRAHGWRASWPAATLKALAQGSWPMAALALTGSFLLPRPRPAAPALLPSSLSQRRFPWTANSALPSFFSPTPRPPPLRLLLRAPSCHLEPPLIAALPLCSATPTRPNCSARSLSRAVSQHRPSPSIPVASAGSIPHIRNGIKGSSPSPCATLVANSPSSSESTSSS